MVSDMMKKGLLIGAGLAFIALLSGCFGRGSFLTEEDALANLDMHFPDRTFEVVEARRRGKGFDGIGAFTGHFYMIYTIRSADSDIEFTVHTERGDDADVFSHMYVRALWHYAQARWHAGFRAEVERFLAAAYNEENLPLNEESLLLVRADFFVSRHGEGEHSDARGFIRPITHYRRNTFLNKADFTFVERVIREYETFEQLVVGLANLEEAMDVIMRIDYTVREEAFVQPDEVRTISTFFSEVLLPIQHKITETSGNRIAIDFGIHYVLGSERLVFDWRQPLSTRDEVRLTEETLIEFDFNDYFRNRFGNRRSEQ